MFFNPGRSSLLSLLRNRALPRPFARPAVFDLSFAAALNVFGGRKSATRAGDKTSHLLLFLPKKNHVVLHAVYIYFCRPCASIWYGKFIANSDLTFFDLSITRPPRRGPLQRKTWYMYEKKDVTHVGEVFMQRITRETCVRVSL